MIGALLLVVGALAGDTRFGVSAGVESLRFDPFLYRRGVRVGGQVGVGRLLEVSASVAAYPVFGSGGEADPEWTDIAKSLLTNNGVAPDLPKRTHEAQVLAHVHVVRVDLAEGWRAGIGVSAGVGVTRFVYDMVRLSGEVGHPPSLYPGPVLGLAWDVRSERVGVRLRWAFEGRVVPEEEGDLLQPVDRVLGADVRWWF